MNFHQLFSGYVPTQVDTNSIKLEPHLLGISSQLKQPHSAVTRDRRYNTHGIRQGSEENWSSSGTSVLDQEQSLVDDASLCSTSPICAAPIIRQFWKAGVYNDELTPKSTTQSGSAYLHIHPRFLHSNATSHKWVFGAVAELIDNAVDEIQNGATFVIIDKASNPRNGSSALLIQDDGGGMDPEAMRRCLSFGFSDKKSISAIGKYGNGFKTSSMRLGADVIVFSRNQTNRTMTQSIGLLSYSFLTRERYNRVVVPMVHYEFNSLKGSFVPLLSNSNQNSNLNLSLLLQWSPYSTEEELLKQFEDVGSHGTKVIIYNLWLDEDGSMELDFESDPEDIRITRDAPGKMKDSSRQATTEQHLANRLRYSLRAYLSILYLKLPETFVMVLRGKAVLYHNVATDLKYTEFIMYKPHTASTEVTVVTTIGFIKEAPLVNIHGFNVYHKNRLILPFSPVVTFSNNRGRGIVGVLEANFIEPTHNKQDFEKTTLYQKLVQRLKEMTWEYWDYHCGLLGYHYKKKARPPSAALGASNFIYQHGTDPSVPVIGPRRSSAAVDATRKAPIVDTTRRPLIVDTTRNAPTVDTTRRAPIIATINSKAALDSYSLAKPVEQSFHRAFQEGSNLKRKSSDQPTSFRTETLMGIGSNKRSNRPGLANTQEATNVMQENRRLRAKCSEFQKAQEELKFKALQLKKELGAAEAEYGRLLAELQYLEKVKGERNVYCV